MPKDHNEVRDISVISIVSTTWLQRNSKLLRSHNKYLFAVITKMISNVSFQERMC